MGAKFTRRAIMAAAPAVVVAVSFEPAQAMPAPSIMALYKQWYALRDQYNHGDDDDVTHDLLYAQMDEIEKQIWPLPCLTAADLAAKFDVQTDCKGFYADDQFGDECKAVLEKARSVCG